MNNACSVGKNSYKFVVFNFRLSVKSLYQIQGRVQEVNRNG